MELCWFVSCPFTQLIVPAGKKSLYVRSGCRGDWPNLAEPGAEVLQDKDSSSQTNSPLKEVVLGEQG
jgi:hypothetical protein